MIRKCLKLTALLIAIWMTSTFVQSEYDHPFPLRAQYHDTPYIELSDFYKQYADVKIVDVRSRVEFDVIHINSAINISLKKLNFSKQLKLLRDSNPTRKIVLYCNGHACAKSYKAVKKAMDAGISNVVAYDAGIFDWANEHPELTTLLNTTPVDPKNIIPNDQFNAVMKSYAEIKALSLQDNVMVIDIRDKFQRKYTPPLRNLKHLPLGRMESKLMMGLYKDKHLVFVDATGKQVRWLQYHLQKFGYNNYYFLKEGVAGIDRDTLGIKPAGMRQK